MSKLSKQEENILLAVWKLGSEAYAIPIRTYLKKITGNSISIGGIYVPLDRLVRKGYLDCYQSESKPERGGMSRRYFNLTKKGYHALQASRHVYEQLWNALPEISFKGSD
ncbi:MAG: helix-turn-helix transcriptional regulator [Candidatus Aminicenantes bacterium]|nr:helix-turn-helix transcriptional regulator [Candidatus Aminicenantes bacterium]